MQASLYVHIPLCLKKCDYCDFFSVATDSFPVNGNGNSGSPGDRVVRTLIREIAEWRDQYKISRWKTVYIGGGTPSLLSPETIGTLGNAIAETSGADGQGADEWTIEANPEDVTEAWLDACARAGINRLSLGVQSLDDASLSSVGRRGSAAKTLETLSLVSRTWKGRLSVDLIAGLPGQTPERVVSNLRSLTPFNPDHVSLYSLTVEDGTPLARKKASGCLAGLPDDDVAAEIWLAGRDWLDSHGFPQYEVSNFAKPGCESLHNLTYWRLQSYVGAGPGATGTIVSGDHETRITNTKDVRAWLADPSKGRLTEVISRKEFLVETILMGMRLVAGIDRRAFRERFGIDIADCIPITLESWVTRGLLSIDDACVALSRKGLLFLNKFLSDCMDELQ